MPISQPTQVSLDLVVPEIDKVKDSESTSETLNKDQQEKDDENDSSEDIYVKDIDISEEDDVDRDPNYSPGSEVDLLDKTSDEDQEEQLRRGDDFVERRDEAETTGNLVREEIPGQKIDINDQRGRSKKRTLKTEL